MNEYVEFFKFPKVTGFSSASVTKDFHGAQSGLTAFVGGCGIGEVESVAEGRLVIYSYLTHELRHRIAEYEQEIANARGFLQELEKVGPAKLLDFKVKEGT